MTTEIDIAALKVDLDSGPMAADYAAAGWGDPLPVYIGGGLDGEGQRIPFTDADNLARYAQAEKYNAIAKLMSDKTKRPGNLSKITDAQIIDSLDETEWGNLGEGVRTFIGTLRENGSDRWRQVLRSKLDVNGATMTSLKALKQSRSDELGHRQRVRAGHIKQANGDNA